MELESIELTAHEALPPPAALELEVAPLSIPYGLPPLHTGSSPPQPTLWRQAVAEPRLRANTGLLGEPQALCSDEILQRFSSLSAVSSGTDSYAWNYLPREPTAKAQPQGERLPQRERLS